MTVRTGVIRIVLHANYSPTAVHDVIENAIAGAPDGAFVRLVVSDAPMPAHIAFTCDSRLQWQIEAPTYTTQQKWEHALQAEAVNV
ncbi:MAG: hypothetical protein ACTJGQ_00920 [Agrococcus casei]|uniref:hypothetical protein n=1 Tax=Agrococcus casei TaxID=343512 RepID=UPI003F8DAB7E